MNSSEQSEGCDSILLTISLFFAIYFALSEIMIIFAEKYDINKFL